MTNRTRHAIAAALTTATLLALAACSGSDDTDDAATEPATEAPTGEEPEPPAVIALGDTHTYDDGLSVSVALTELFAPNDYGNFGDDDQYAMLTATVTNDTGTPVEIGSVFQDCSLDGANVAHELFQDVTSYWPDLVQDGDEGTWQYACLTEGGTDLTAQMQINEYPAVYFTGTVPQE